MSEIVLCPLIAPDSPPKLGLRSRSNSVYSDLSTLVSPAAHDGEDLNNLAPYSVVPNKKQGRSRSEGLVFPYNIDQQQSQPRGRRRRTMSTTFTGATGSASLSACSTLNSYRISLSDITMTTIYSPSALQQIDISTDGKGCYELHFDTKNAYDVVLTFLQSLLPKSRKQIRFHEQLAKNMSTPSPNKSVAPNSPKDRQNRSSECMSRSGSFDMDQFMEQKLKERVNNESAFERFKRKMSKLSQDVNELVVGFQIPDLCANQCERTLAEEEKADYIKTMRNLDGVFAASLDNASPREPNTNGQNTPTNVPAANLDDNHDLSGNFPNRIAPEVSIAPLDPAFSYELSPNRSSGSIASHARKNSLLFLKSKDSSRSKISIKSSSSASVEASAQDLPDKCSFIDKRDDLAENANHVVTKIVDL